MRTQTALVPCHGQEFGLVGEPESEMMRATRSCRMNKKYIVRLTDQERDELAGVIK